MIILRKYNQVDSDHTKQGNWEQSFKCNPSFSGSRSFLLLGQFIFEFFSRHFAMPRKMWANN